MADTFDSRLKLRLQESGGNSGQWGALLNQTVTNIASVFGYGTHQLSNDADATLTLSDDGASIDALKSSYLKITSAVSLTATRTLTFAPNTLNQVKYIENATTGSQSITISQGSGANITIESGATKVVYFDGAGSGAAVVDALANIDQGTAEFDTIKVATIQANDGTASSTIADSTGVMTIASSVLTTADINGGTIDNAAIGASTPAAGTFTTFTSNGIDDNADAIAITIDSSEKVKIGSAAGSEKLSVAGSITTDGYIYPTTDNGWSLGLSTNRWGSVFAQTADFENSVGIGVSSIATNTKLHVKAGTNLNFEVEDSSSTLRLSALNDARSANVPMQFASSSFQFITGKVGIGNDSPNRQLSLKHASQAEIGFKTGSVSNGALIYYNDSENQLLLRAQETTDHIAFQTGGATERLRISSSGDLILAANATGAALIKGVSGDQTSRNSGGYPQFTFVGNEGTGIRRPSANVLAFDTGGDEAMRISGGNLLVGKTATALATAGLTFGGAGFASLTRDGAEPLSLNRLSDDGKLAVLYAAGTEIGSLFTNGGAFVVKGNSASAPVQLQTHDGNEDIEVDPDGFIKFETAGSEAMRIDSSQNLLVGTTSSGQPNENYFQARDASGFQVAVGHSNTVSNGQPYFYMTFAGVAIGSITQATGSSVAYNTSSDQRLKQNIQPAAEDAGELIDAIQVRQFDWKADGEHQRFGMVAQELQAVAPEAVSAPEDPEEMMGVDYSKLVPMLIKEIQTLRSRVQQLENN